MYTSKLNTLETRKFIHETVIARRDLRCWRTWTDECRAYETLGQDTRYLRNLVFALVGRDKFTLEELAVIEQVTGCKKAHVTGGSGAYYLRLNWVTFAEAQC